jgi:hypothetical protein
MIVTYGVAGPIYVYVSSHSILSRILATVVMLQHVFVEYLGGARTV